MNTSAWERILNVGKSDDVNRNPPGVQEQQGEPGSAPEDDHD